METSKFSVKFFARDGSAADEKVIVPLFHRWIQDQAIPGHILIDVADYAHVNAGPGVVLVSHEANFSTDEALDHRVGLLYQRKAPIEGDTTAQLRAVFHTALTAVSLLENSFELGGKLKFRTDDPIFRIHDRLFAPNTKETFNAVWAALESFLKKLYNAPVELTHTPGDETLFEVRIKAPNVPAADLLSRL
jgi:hypothetical protein